MASGWFWRLNLAGQGTTGESREEWEGLGIPSIKNPRLRQKGSVLEEQRGTWRGPGTWGL